MLSHTSTVRYNRTEQAILDGYRRWGSDPLTFEALLAAFTGWMTEESLSRAFARLVEQGALVHTEGGYIRAGGVAEG